jgi:NTP pyrophosphatase (non-canonical NTP hydrolase)
MWIPVDAQNIDKIRRSRSMENGCCFDCGNNFTCRTACSCLMLGRDREKCSYRTEYGNCSLGCQAEFKLKEGLKEPKLPELIKEYFEKYDSRHVEICAIEEMSELTKVLTKHMRSSRKFTKEKLTEELAHVMLLSFLLKREFKIDNELIQEEQKKALLKALGMEG